MEEQRPRTRLARRRGGRHAKKEPGFPRLSPVALCCLCQATSTLASPHLRVTVWLYPALLPRRLFRTTIHAQSRLCEAAAVRRWDDCALPSVARNFPPVAVSRRNARREIRCDARTTNCPARGIRRISGFSRLLVLCCDSACAIAKCMPEARRGAESGFPWQKSPFVERNVRLWTKRGENSAGTAKTRHRLSHGATSAAERGKRVSPFKLHPAAFRAPFAPA